MLDTLAWCADAPDRFEPLANLAMLLLNLGRLGEAVVLGQRALALAPALAGLWYNLGLSHRAIGNLEAAGQAFGVALDRDPEFDAARCALGVCRYELGDLDAAARLLTETLRRAPALVDAANALGCAELDRHRLGPADRAFGHALAVAPDHAEVMSNLWALRRDQNDDVAASRWLDRAERANPNLYALWRNRANQARDRKDYLVEAQAHRRAGTLSAAASTPADSALAQTRTIYHWALLASAGRADPNRSPPVNRQALPGVTLICVDTLNYDLTIAALRHCLALCQFERAIYATDQDFDVPGVEIHRIDRFDGNRAYNRYVMKELWRHVTTPFALVAQYDGFIVNPGAWQPEFAESDYIGAPWSQYHDGMIVGNGGFCLRSARLLAALKDPGYSETFPEDLMICRTYRPSLEERYGIRFADPALAARFAFEGGGQHRLRAPRPFGFHDFSNLATLIDGPDALAVLLDLATMTVYRSRQPVELALNFLRDGRPALAAQVARAVLGKVSDHREDAALRDLAAG